MTAAIANEVVHKQNAGNVLIGEIRSGSVQAPGVLLELESKSPNVYSASMIVDDRHPFFFEHPLDHVPGLMMVEAARQFAVACCHVVGGVPLSGMHFILEHLEIEAVAFLELVEPVEILGTLEETAPRRHGYIRGALIRCVFAQRDCAVTSASVRGKIVPDDLYRRIRTRA